MTIYVFLILIYSRVESFKENKSSRILNCCTDNKLQYRHSFCYGVTQQLLSMIGSGCFGNISQNALEYIWKTNKTPKFQRKISGY